MKSLKSYGIGEIAADFSLMNIEQNLISLVNGRLAKDFESIDKDGDGYLTLEELVEVKAARRKHRSGRAGKLEISH